MLFGEGLRSPAALPGVLATQRAVVDVRPVARMTFMETIPISEAKARIAELADRVAREHDHFTITRNGRADVMLISVAEYESMRETLDLISDGDALADLRQSREDFAAGDTFAMDEVLGELKRRS
ncbi:type II toxin-antitoxin system Phd/YefM family antitoxin [Solwaraspora sp. WMMD791]|nr:type II toxin-antitoxin system Phd/YefM family antitoxin [Solwaraspora sp. WMMD791]WFE26296.1 type II toxin-antitoxin system Phd/YefM family antitoxin [Solwaraspora sp. WMMD791]